MRPAAECHTQDKGHRFFSHADQFRPLNNLFNFFAGLFLPLCREWREKFRKAGPVTSARLADQIHGLKFLPSDIHQKKKFCHFSDAYVGYDVSGI